MHDLSFIFKFNYIYNYVYLNDIILINMSVFRPRGNPSAKIQLTIHNTGDVTCIVFELELSIVVSMKIKNKCTSKNPVGCQIWLFKLHYHSLLNSYLILLGNTSEFDIRDLYLYCLSCPLPVRCVFWTSSRLQCKNSAFINYCATNILLYLLYNCFNILIYK